MLALLFSTGIASGHEFWIAPQGYQVAPGENLDAQLRVGQNFDGFEQPYLPRNFARFEVQQDDERHPVQGRVGDRPAMRMALQDEGLWIVVHETTDQSLIWDTWADFEAFVTHKKLEGVVARHADRGLPSSDFAEAYRRYAKALVAVGAGLGADEPVGLLTEIVAGRNPYTDDLSDGLPVTVLYDGAPRVGAQVEIFDRAPDGTVSVSTTMTDAAGQAVIPVVPGHEYLLDAVKMIELEGGSTPIDPVWKSLWAALTFYVPGAN